jgi:hypothetical protein
MDIRVQRTNRIFFDVSPETAVILLEMFPDKVERLKTSYQERLALLEAERQKGQSQPQPGVQIKFTVEKNRLTEKLQLVLRCGSEEVFYSGPPIHAAAAFGGGGRTPPEAIIREYAEALEYNKPVDPLVELERRRKIAERDGQPKEPSWPRYK